MSEQRVRNFRMSDETWGALGELCARRGTTRSDLIREVLQGLVATDARERMEARAPRARYVLGLIEVDADVEDARELLMAPISREEAWAILERFREAGR